MDEEQQKAHDALVAAVNEWDAQRAAAPAAEGMPPDADVTKQPLGYLPPKAPVDTELAAAQQSAALRRGIGALGNSVDNLTQRPDAQLNYIMKLGGGGGIAPAPKSDFWDRYSQEGDRAVGDLLARRKSEGDMASKQAAGAAEASRADPNSQESQFARAIIGKYAPGIDVTGKSAKQITAFAPFISKAMDENRDLAKTYVANQSKASEAEAKATADAAKEAESKRRFELSHADAQANAAATRALAGASLGLRQDEVATKKAESVTDDVQKLAKELPGDERDFEQKYESIKAAAAAHEGDIPGVGFWDAHKPDALSTAEDLNVQKAAGQMLASYQKLITGTGASDAERENLKNISLKLSNEKSFLAGLESLKAAYTAKVKQVRAGFRPEVVSQYEKNAAREFGVSPTVSNTKTITINGKRYRETGDPSAPLEEIE